MCAAAPSPLVFTGPDVVADVPMSPEWLECYEAHACIGKRSSCLLDECDSKPSNSGDTSDCHLKCIHTHSQCLKRFAASCENFVDFSGLPEVLTMCMDHYNNLLNVQRPEQPWVQALITTLLATGYGSMVAFATVIIVTFRFGLAFFCIWWRAHFKPDDCALCLEPFSFAQCRVQCTQCRKCFHDNCWSEACSFGHHTCSLCRGQDTIKILSDVVAIDTKDMVKANHVAQFYRRHLVVLLNTIVTVFVTLVVYHYWTFRDVDAELGFCAVYFW
ncbi:E3 ubiquitin protein ligase [bacterium]|nr:E3 ubiquitin protein ligase [bacterium]